MLDVLVVGAGPAGSRVAYKLAGMGHDTAVVDLKKTSAQHICCTGIIGQECVVTFDIGEKLILRQFNSARLFSPSGKLLRLWRPEVQASIVNRASFDAAMADRAQSKGARYIMDSEVRNIEVEENRVRVDVTHCECRSSLEARVVVIASGFQSRLTKRLGLGERGDFVIGAQAEVSSSVDELEVHFGQDIAPGFFAWLVPITRHKALVGVLSRHNSGFYLTKFISSQQLQKKIDATGADIRYGGIPLKPLTKTYADRLVVVGDAAGQVKPTTGGGIYYGLLCADIAAGVLNQALNSNNLTAGDMAIYERKWQAKLSQELKIGYQARKFYERLTNGQIDQIFDIIMALGIAEAPLSFDWHGTTLLRLLEGRLMSEVIKMVKMPLHVGKGSTISEVPFDERKASESNP